jgi:hypothetical protein
MSSTNNKCSYCEKKATLGWNVMANQSKGISFYCDGCVKSRCSRCAECGIFTDKTAAIYPYGSTTPICPDCDEDIKKGHSPADNRSVLSDPVDDYVGGDESS